MTNTVDFKYKSWQAQCIPCDGARLSRLSHEGCDFLTSVPVLFQAPSENPGEYETRPVYGYDDCFPTVDPCLSPFDNSKIPDHGTLCWQPWIVESQNDRILCYVTDKRYNISFSRNLIFEEKELTWEFEVTNNSDKAVNYLHVMHALIPLKNVNSISLPNYIELFDELGEKVIEISEPSDLANRLLKSKNGDALMLILRKIENGNVVIKFNSNFELTISFPIELFSNLGIWWNNYGYPNEEGIRRCECAFEPISGPFSSLYKSYESGQTLCVGHGKKVKWTINWAITKT